MRSLLGLLPLLGCGVMMFVCMAMMSRGRHSTTDAAAPDTDLTDEVARLRAEVASLRDAADRKPSDAAGG